MPSTYTLNNGIELIATGEQSGSWGDSTNTNLSLIDTSLDGQVTVTLASAGNSGAPNDLPINDGAASNGRNRLVIFNDGADLGATAYVQLTPNDAEKLVYVRNNLSGSRSIILFQGTYNASNDYEVPAGTTALVYFDGGGTGAVAANVFNNAYFDSLRLGAVSVTAILDEDNMASDSATALATQQSIKAYVDSQVGTVDTLSEILANGNTTGANNIIVSSGQAITTNTISETTAASGVTVDSLLIKDGGITAAGTSTFAGQTITDLGAVTTADINGGTIDGAVIGGSSAAAITGTTVTGTSFVSSGDMTFGDNDKAIFGAGSDLQIYHDGSNSIIDDIGTGNLYIRSNDILLDKYTGERMIRAIADGAVTLYYDNSAKLATSSAGVSVTGALSVVSGTNAGITVNDGTVNTIIYNTNSTSSSIGTTTNHPTTFWANNSERARISAAGGFSVGTTADPGVGAIYATGNITAYYSDDRLKTNLGKIENALEKVESLEGFYYEANETAQALGYKAEREVGISAQSVEKIMPEVVAPAPIDEQYLTVRYERLVPLLIESIKELSAEVKELRAKVNGE